VVARQRGVIKPDCPTGMRELILISKPKKMLLLYTGDESMNWEEVGAIGQVLGSIAVFVTLGYLAIQVKHARQESRRALSQGRSEAHRDLLARQVSERILAATIKADAGLGAIPHQTAGALMEQGGLTLEEALRVINMNTAWWTYFLQIIPYVDELPAMERTAFENRVRGAYGRPGAGRLFYETYLKPTAHADALRFVDDVLERSG
jgi:hypothetical protein